MHADQRTAWRNPEWVRAVMHYPDDTVLLDRLATGAELTVRKRVEDELQQDAMRAGKAAANVLLTLYALDQAKWTLPCAQRWLGFFGHDDKWTDCCTFPLWKEQIRCEDRDETIPLPSRPG